MDLSHCICHHISFLWQWLITLWWTSNFDTYKYMNEMVNFASCLCWGASSDSWGPLLLTWINVWSLKHIISELLYPIRNAHGIDTIHHYVNPVWGDFRFSWVRFRCRRCRRRCNDFCFSRQNLLSFTLDIWYKESIGLGKCTEWPFGDLVPRSQLWHW